jgi:N-acyl-D-amino-acid deacylase
VIDVLIKNGEIVDGTNSPRYQSDIAIMGENIVDIGIFEDTDAETIIDATDRIIAPGFIDIHSHADLSLMVAPEGESLIQQGITSVVGGQCGLSPAPLTKKNRKEALRTISSIGAPKTAIPLDKAATFGAYLDYMDTIKPAVNVLPLVGQGMVRSAVMGYGDKSASPADIKAMQQLVHEAMQSGAFGISTGLIYPPGSFSSTEELIEVVKPAAEYGGIYFSHMRGEAGTLLESINETIRIGREAGIGVQVSHFKAAGQKNWDQAAPALEIIEESRNRGLDVTADMYPYTAGSTHLGVLLPKWALKGGITGVFKRLLLPWERKKIIQAMKDGEGGVVENIEWDKVLICRSPEPAYLLRYISELAAEVGKDPYVWTLDALVKTLGDAGMVIILMSEENLRVQLQHPAMMIGTDGFGMATEGPMSKGMLHPRCFGTYPRLFGKYVREEGILSLEEASWKASGFPAKKLGLKNRGRIGKGCQADLVVFNPETIIDRATYSDPLQYPIGIDYVFVNGQTTLQRGEQQITRAGKVLRKTN